MGFILEESDTQTLKELLNTVFEAESGTDAISDALYSLKSMIELPDEDDDNDTRDRVAAMKQYILITKPELFDYLVKVPQDEDGDLDSTLACAKTQLVAEMLRNYAPAKLAFMPHIDTLLQSCFRENVDWNSLLRAQDETTQYAMAQLLRPSAGAEEAVRKVRGSLSEQVQSFSDVSSPTLLASEMTEALAKRQASMVHGLSVLVSDPLKSDAITAFIQSGALDALLSVLLRGPFSVEGIESPNESVEEACNALYRLMEDSACKELAEALVERQVASPLLERMSHICGLEGIYAGSYIPRALVALSKKDETLQKQVTAQAEQLMISDNTGAGVAIVLWKLLEAAGEFEFEEMQSISKTASYVPFFLRYCERGTSDDVLAAVGDALFARVGQPGDQLKNGISTPEQVEKFMILVEYACEQSAPDISSTVQVLRELVLPMDLADTGGFIDPDEDLRRVDKDFCQKFGKVMKVRYDAAMALASKGEGDHAEPCEEGLAHMKNLGIISVVVEEQYSAAALITEGLLDYQRHLVFNPCALSRRAGLELLLSLTRDASLTTDFAYVPMLIEAFTDPAVYMLDDPRALNRALAMQWLERIMSYRHPKGQNRYGYKPAIDFVLEKVSEGKLLEMLKGTENEAKTAAGMIAAMVQKSDGPEVRKRLRQNEELIEALWKGALGSEEEAQEDPDADISDDAFIFGNIQPCCGEALTAILDPFADRTSIATHIIPRLAEAKKKEPYEFADIATDMPAVASLAMLAPETEVLSTVGQMISNEEHLPYAMRALLHLSQGTMLATVFIGLSDDIYPALVKVLQEGDESMKSTVVDDLAWLLNSSTVSKQKFRLAGGIEPLLALIPSEDNSTSRRATSAFISLVTNYPEGAKASIEVGAVEVLKAKADPDDIFNRANNALSILEELKDAPPIDRIDFTPEAYTAVGKAGDIDRLVKNLESSTDEKQLAIAGGLISLFTDMLRSGKDVSMVLKALYTIYVADGVLVGGNNIPARVGEQCGLPDALKLLAEDEDKEIKELAARIRSAVLMERDKEVEDEAGGEQEEIEDGAENEEDPEEVD